MRRFMDRLRRRTRWEGNRYHSQRAISISYYETLFRSLARFFNWCKEQGYIEDTPMGSIPKPKVPKKVIRTLSYQELTRLFNLTDPDLYPTPGKQFLATRNRAVLGLLIDTPIRRSELTGMAVADVHLQEGRLLVNGKGNKQRYMYMGTATSQ